MTFTYYLRITAINFINKTSVITFLPDKMEDMTTYHPQKL